MNIQRTSGNILVTAGLKMIQQSFNLSPKQMVYGEMMSFLANKLPGVEQALCDNNYYLTDIATLKDFIASDWTKEYKYLVDKYDCEDFALTFAAHLSEILDISSSFSYGKVYDKNTKVLIGYHYYNALITIEADNSKHLYLYEPQGADMAEVTGQKDIIIGDWIYKPIKISVF